MRNAPVEGVKVVDCFRVSVGLLLSGSEVWMISFLVIRRPGSPCVVQVPMWWEGTDLKWYTQNWI